MNFWKGIADVGLLGEVVTNISTELLELLNGVKQRSETAALQDTGAVQSCWMSKQYMTVCHTITASFRYMNRFILTDTDHRFQAFFMLY